MRKNIFTLVSILFFATQAHSKPSYSFGDEPRHCKADTDCAIIIVSCHGCDWADSVNKKSLEASRETVRKYCEGWKKQKNKEVACTEAKPFSKREALCSNGICEARTYY